MYRDANVAFFPNRRDKSIGWWKALNSPPFAYDDSPICSVNLGRFKAGFFIAWPRMWNMFGWATEMMPRKRTRKL